MGLFEINRDRYSKIMNDISAKVNTDPGPAACSAESSMTCDAPCSAKSSAPYGPAFAPTPIEFFGTVGGAELYVKRDDLIPAAFGGNKVRIAAEVLAEMERRGSRALITYGSASSNLNRAAAIMAKTAGVKCYAIIKMEDAQNPDPAHIGETFNGRFLKASGAKIVPCTSDTVFETVSRVLEESTVKGENPFYIYGDATGHGNEELLAAAYRKVFREITEQEKRPFGHIFTAVGTGGTIRGLIEACDEAHHITGISIARPKEKILAGLSGLAGQAGFADHIGRTGPGSLTGGPDGLDSFTGGHNGPDGPADGRFDITDDYLFGGYGKYSDELLTFIRQTVNEKNLPLDATYTGKALFGTVQEIRKRCLTGPVLFIHTGGTPLYYDMLEKG